MNSEAKIYTGKSAFVTNAVKVFEELLFFKNLSENEAANTSRTKNQKNLAAHFDSYTLTLLHSLPLSLCFCVKS